MNCNCNCSGTPNCNLLVGESAPAVGKTPVGKTPMGKTPAGKTPRSSRLTHMDHMHIFNSILGKLEMLPFWDTVGYSPVG